MKTYPNNFSEDGSYSAEDIKKGIHWLHTDVTCIDCFKVYALSQVSTTFKKCPRCGGDCK